MTPGQVILSFIFFKQLFDNIPPVQYLKEDEAGNIWFVSNKRLGVVDFQGKPQRFFCLN